MGSKSGNWREQPKERPAYPENPVRGKEINSENIQNYFVF